MKLYHYCSLETLFSIIGNEIIWVSSLTDSNDSLEDRFLFNSFIDFLSENPKNNAKTWKAEFEKAKSLTNIYGMSFSEKADDALLWNVYGKIGGVGIEFDYDKLNCYFKKLKCLESRAKLTRIKYISYNRSLKRFFRRIIKKNDKNLPNCYRELLYKSKVSKTTDWEHEKEWRLVLRNFIDRCGNNSLPPVTFSEKECKLKYIFKNGNPVFYYEVPLDISLIETIVLGPQCRISVEKLKSQLCLLNNSFDSDKIQIKYSRFYNQ